MTGVVTNARSAILAALLFTASGGARPAPARCALRVSGLYPNGGRGRIPRMRWWTCVVVALVGGCAMSHDQLSGVRADGLMVMCAPSADDGELACDPKQDGDDRGDGDGDDDGADDPGAHDGCTDWAAGGPAIVLWPPNHKMHSITIDDCAAVRSECAIATRAAAGGEIVSVSSDEPLDVGAGGDGDTETGDMQLLDARTVALRAERQGGSDGRVYRIELRAPDGSTAYCEVHVPHDRGPYGGAVASPVAVEIRP